MIKPGQRWRGKYSRILVVEILRIKSKYETECDCFVKIIEPFKAAKITKQQEKFFPGFPTSTLENNVWELLEGQEAPL